MFQGDPGFDGADGTPGLPGMKGPPGLRASLNPLLVLIVRL